MKIRSWMIALPCLLASGLPAAAACNIAALAGRWMLYTLSSDGATPFTTACDVTVTNRGRASGDCADSFGGQGQISATLKLVNAARCTYSGTFTQFGDKYSIDLFSINRERSVIQGVGSGSGVFLLNGIKQ